MASKEKRRTELRHLTRALVREGFSMTDVLGSLAEALEEEAKRVDTSPGAHAEVVALEREALALQRISRSHRKEFP